MNLQETYKYSWFSNLAYVKWDDINTSSPDRIIDVAKHKDFERIPEKLGEEIFLRTNLNWTIDHFNQNDPDTGFAASLYSNSNEKILAIRGTEPKGNQIYYDLIKADIKEIGFTGLAIDQAVSMYNYIQRLKGNKGSDVRQLKFKKTTQLSGYPDPTTSPFIKTTSSTFVTSTYYWFEESTAIGAGLGEIDENDKITLTGHSLGGHLAVYAQRAFPEFSKRNSSKSTNSTTFPCVPHFLGIAVFSIFRIFSTRLWMEA